MKILLFVNTRKDEDLSFTKGIQKCLEQKEIEYALFKASTDDATVSDDVLCGIDIAVVLGGDGTMLHGAREASKKDIPVFGVNIGNLGFLTEIEYNDFELAIDKIIAKDYCIEQRIVLRPTLDSVSDNELIAVNDVCIISTEPGKMISLKIMVNDDFIEEFAGDGIIVSSPTGSTGYSLSAGGPIVSPETRCIILTPIAAHSIAIKPLVLCDRDVVNICISGNKKGLAIIDGQKRVEATSITVEKSTSTVKFIRFNDYNFFGVLSKKLSNNNKNK